MKYDHLVKHNGIYYVAGENVPDSSPAILESDVAEEMEDNVQDDNVVNNDVDSTHEYSRSDISRMAVADLKELAPKLGIEVTEESTGAKLKEQIIEKLAL